MEDKVKSLGLKVQGRREYLGISQQSLATKMGWARTSVSKLETGMLRTMPSTEDIRLLGKILETTAEALTGDAETFFFDRFPKDIQDKLRDPRSTELIKAVLAAMRA